MENLEKLHKKIAGSVSFKLAVVAVLTLLLLIPAAMIQELIREREQRRNETIMEVTSKWGNTQTICGPVLTVPYKTYEKTKEGTETLTHYLHCLPSALTINGRIIPQERHRGIYKVIAYNARLTYQGTFENPDLKSLSIEPSDVM